MKPRWALGLLAMSAVGLATQSVAAPPSAAMLANACAGCHGTLGASAGPSMPSLASQSKASLVEAMRKFRSGDRPSTVMGRLAKGYSDADIDALGDFFARQKFHATAQTVDAGKVSRGAQLQEANCSRCHLDDGKDGKDDTPVMASQWLPYLQMQMALYQSGKRKMPDKMAEKVKPLSADDLEALMHFYASVK